MKAVSGPGSAAAEVFMLDESEDFQKTLYREKGNYKTLLTSQFERCSDFMFKVLLYHQKINCQSLKLQYVKRLDLKRLKLRSSLFSQENWSLE